MIYNYTISLARIIAVLAWINAFAWLWAMALVPAVQENGSVWTLVFFVSVALIASIISESK